MNAGMDIVILGLSLSSSWGNGHATTYRSLIPGLTELGCRVQFLERDVPWYASRRDLPDPDFCTLDYYSGLADLERYAGRIRAADAVIVGSYVPDGVQVIDFVRAQAPERLCFYDIDTPVTLARLEQGDEEYVARRQIPLFDLYLSFSGGTLLRRLEDSYGAPRAEALYCSVDPALHHRTGEAVTWDLGYLGTYSPDRQPSLERLLLEPARRLPGRRFVVAGSMYPDDIEWPENVDRIEHLPPAEHASFYSRQRFTLNLTRGDMAAAGWSPSVRLFEAAAIGTPLISDPWPGLADIFPINDAILLAHDADDVIRALSLDARKRERIGETARRIVLGEHTGTVRARRLFELLKSIPAHAADRRLQPEPV